MVDTGAIRRRFKLIEKHLDERMRRLLAGAEAEAVGRGGVSVVARATGVSRRALWGGAGARGGRGGDWGGGPGVGEGRAPVADGRQDSSPGRRAQAHGGSGPDADRGLGGID